MVFNGVLETHSILQRFLNPWYLTGNFLERLFARFKKILGNTFPMDGLARETATLDKWLNRDFNPR